MDFTIRVATGQGKVREIHSPKYLTLYSLAILIVVRTSQGILELVREIWNFVESQGNS